MNKIQEIKFAKKRKFNVRTYGKLENSRRGNRKN